MRAPRAVGWVARDVAQRGIRCQLLATMAGVSRGVHYNIDLQERTIYYRATLNACYFQTGQMPCNLRLSSSLGVGGRQGQV